MVNCKHPDCYYRNVKLDFCQYCVITGQHRPCPPGDCIGVYRPKDESRTFALTVVGKRVTFDKEKAMSLYIEGKSDAEIGKELGVSYKAIRNWRNYEGLPSTKAMKGDAEWT